MAKPAAAAAAVNPGKLPIDPLKEDDLGEYDETDGDIPSSQVTEAESTKESTKSAKGSTKSTKGSTKSTKESTKSPKKSTKTETLTEDLKSTPVCKKPAANTKSPKPSADGLRAKYNQWVVEKTRELIKEDNSLTKSAARKRAVELWHKSPVKEAYVSGMSMAERKRREFV